MSEAIIRDAIKLRDQLLDVEKEIGYRRNGNKLNATDAKTCSDAAKMLEKLGTEVTRLRLSIGHFYFGKMTKGELYNVTQNWNGDPKGAPDV